MQNFDIKEGLVQLIQALGNKVNGALLSIITSEKLQRRRIALYTIAFQTKKITKEWIKFWTQYFWNKCCVR